MTRLTTAEDFRAMMDRCKPVLSPKAEKVILKAIRENLIATVKRKLAEK